MAGRRFQADAYEAELDEELRHHLDLYAADLEAEGVAPAEARRRARLEFGTVDAVKEACREATEPLLHAFWRDLRHGFARLARRPGFTLVALVTLAVAIGANGAVFSLVDAVLLRPLPYPAPERLATVHTTYGEGGEIEHGAVDGLTWETVRDATPALRAAPYSGWASGVNLVARETPHAASEAGETRTARRDAVQSRATPPRASHVQQQRVGAGFFSVLGVEPARGRTFTAAEDRPGGAAVVILSDRLWRDTFDADPDVTGRRITLRGEPHTVIGVMPPGFRSTNSLTDLWTPLRPSTEGEGAGTNYGIVARLADGASWQQAESQLAAASARRFPDSDSPRAPRLGLQPLQASLASGLEAPLLLLWATVGAVLLIACVNLAGLLLAQGAARRGEIATRMAIGGGRGPIVRQLLTEGLALGVAGAATGVGLAFLTVGALEEHVLGALGLPHTLRVDLRVVTVTVLASLLASLLFSAYPAWASSRLGRPRGRGGRRGGGGLRAALVSATAGAGRDTGGGGRVRRALLVAQVALAVTLLLAASLLAGSFGHLRSVEPGFQPDGLITATVSLDEAGYATAASVDALLRESVRRLEESAAIGGAAAGLAIPYERPLNVGFRMMDDPPDANSRTTNMTYVTPGYFEVLGAPLLAGRPLREADGAPGASRVALVNQALVDTYLDGRSPLGRSLLRGDEDWRVVGVVGDLVQRPGFGDYEPLAAVPTVYVPVAAMPDGLVALAHTWFPPSWVVRPAAGASSEAAADALREALRTTAPELPIARLRTFAEIRRDTLSFQWLMAVLMAGLAGIALLLTAVGLAGVVGSTVQEKKGALGIRLALGATRGRAIRQVLLPVLALTGAGLALGLGLGPLASRFLRGLLYGVRPDQPVVLLAVAGGMLVVAAVAALLPALRITGIDPARSLRAE